MKAGRIEIISSSTKEEEIFLLEYGPLKKPIRNKNPGNKKIRSKMAPKAMLI